MKLKEGWVLTEMDGDYIVVPTKASAESFSGIVRLNETGKDIWQGLEEGLEEDALVEKLLGLYDGVDRDRARQAVRNVVAKLKQEGLLTE